MAAMKIQTNPVSVEAASLDSIEPGKVYTITNPVNALVIPDIPKVPVESRIIFTTGDSPDITFPDGIISVSEIPKFLPETTYMIVTYFGAVTVIQIS